MDEFHDLIGRLDRPMYVLTAAHDGTRAGCLVGFATQTCIDPPRFLVCVSDKNFTHRVATLAGTVAVHVLRRDQHDVAALFGGETGDEVDKFARVAWTAGADGVPLLDDCLWSFTGTVLDRIGFGDHTGLVLEPVDVRAVSDGPPLTFDQVRDLEPGHEA